MSERTYTAASGYRFGFGGQEKDNEVYNNANTYTADYWEYDARLGRRWNTDPVVKAWESQYATFANNPIYYSDPNGADVLGWLKKTWNKVKSTFNKVKKEFGFDSEKNPIQLSEVEVYSSGPSEDDSPPLKLLDKIVGGVVTAYHSVGDFFSKFKFTVKGDGRLTWGNQFGANVKLAGGQVGYFQGSNVDDLLTNTVVIQHDGDRGEKWESNPDEMITDAINLDFYYAGKGGVYRKSAYDELGFVFGSSVVESYEENIKTKERTKIQVQTSGNVAAIAMQTATEVNNDKTTGKPVKGKSTSALYWSAGAKGAFFLGFDFSISIGFDEAEYKQNAPF